MDIHHHTHAARIVLVLRLVKSLVVPALAESFSCLSLLTFCHIILFKTIFLFIFGCKGKSKCRDLQSFSYQIIVFVLSI